MSSSMRRLARSAHFEVLHEFETVWLKGAGLAPVVIGDFYGDPEVAIIDAQERWCAVAGLGVIVYFIEAPFEAYAYRAQENSERTGQYFEVGRDVPGKWWVESLVQTGDCMIEVRLEGGAVQQVSFQRTQDGCEFVIAPLRSASMHEPIRGEGDE